MKRFAFVGLSKGLFALIDCRDRRAVARHKWQVKIRPRGTAYAVTTIRDVSGRRRFISLHRFLWDLHGGAQTPIVDHENGWGLDCRWTNLRQANHRQNAQNAAVHRGSASGIKGITFDKRRRKWVGRLTIGCRRVEVSCSRHKRVAARLYKVAARQAYGEFARVS